MTSSNGNIFRLLALCAQGILIVHSFDCKLIQNLVMLPYENIITMCFICERRTRRDNVHDANLLAYNSCLGSFIKGVYKQLHFIIFLMM